MIRQIFLVLAVAALAAGGMWYGSKRFAFKTASEQPEQIETIPVELHAIEQVVRATGEVVASQATDIKSEVSGRIEKLHVKAGNKVKTGDLLVELNSADLKSDEEASRLLLEGAGIRREKVALDFARKKKLRAQSFVMEKDVEDVTIDLHSSDNELEIARARLQTIKERVAKTFLRAPHDGTVLNVKAKTGAVITGADSAGESSLLMQIAELSHLQVQSEINEVDVLKVSQGMAATVTFDSLPGVEVKGTVENVALSALPKDKDKTIRVFALLVTLEPSGSPIKPGITANVTISTAKNPGAIAVAVSAVFYENSKPCVFVEKEHGRFEKRDVELGITDNNLVEIKKGVREGERIATQRPPQSDQGGHRAG